MIAPKANHGGNACCEFQGSGTRKELEADFGMFAEKSLFGEAW
jgi:hypothetical protein